MPKKPKAKPGFNYLPDDITVVGSAELGVRHTYMVSQFTYALAQVALADAKSVQMRDELKMVESRLSGKLDNGKEKWRYENRLYKNDTWRTLQQEYHVHLAYYNLLQAVVDGFDRKASCISREITRRQQEVDTSRRSM